MPSSEMVVLYETLVFFLDLGFKKYINMHNICETVEILQFLYFSAEMQVGKLLTIF